MTHEMVYWITRLDAANIFLIISASILGLSGVFTLIGTVCDEVDWPWPAMFLFLALVGGLLAVATPTTKQGVAIYVLPQIVNNEQVQELPDNILKLTNEWIKDQTESLKEQD